MKWFRPSVNGASHIWISSRVLLTPSIKFVTTRGSLPYSGKIFISGGSAVIYQENSDLFFVSINDWFTFLISTGWPSLENISIPFKPT
jgi:hypothetical protein